mmetsp:Transcript_27869/g.66370  ORF Transcript_27869/g.66370 Transcript_27869/m.66370 type:complete len:224 (-) Transcript_27869:3-674(-)
MARSRFESTTHVSSSTLDPECTASTPPAPLPRTIEFFICTRPPSCAVTPLRMLPRTIQVSRLMLDLAPNDATPARQEVTTRHFVAWMRAPEPVARPCIQFAVKLHPSMVTDAPDSAATPCLELSMIVHDFIATLAPVRASTPASRFATRMQRSRNDFAWPCAATPGPWLFEKVQLIASNSAPLLFCLFTTGPSWSASEEPPTSAPSEEPRTRTPAPTCDSTVE